ncbi:hypothetical protein MVES1_001344 [Malassezia vespertilionis]|uniref:uncharacterized protein n=1 Tax=Malassezia vespertilionis TaxID=2020962 RepID=UPI0024B04AAC|nr:uncharacterized protein MVES1_001344 [Malassezia vespertilionis]WFD06006.1 hypothetical protein MVES1_001344 [Malassezia vespertilionis]
MPRKQDEDVFQKLRTHYASVPSALYAVLDACTAEPFQTVVLRNLPHLTTAAKLEKKLRRSYALLGKPFEVCALRARRLPPLGGGDGPQRVSSILTKAPFPLLANVTKLAAHHSASSFLVRLQSAAEAMRLVRSWHRTRYMPQKYSVERTGDAYVVDAHILY